MVEFAPLRVQVIAQTQFTPPPDVPWETDADGGQALAEFAGRACYQSWTKPNPSTATNKGYLNHILEVGHLSVLEHGSISFYLEGVSRSLTHELIRHRHFSYSQLSQRYVPGGGSAFVEPEVIASDPELHKAFEAAAQASLDAYDTLLTTLEERFADVPNGTLRRKQARQAARAVLPNATETKIVVTGNYRAIRHFVAMRASEAADVEIRALAIAVLRECQRVAGNVFADFTISTLEDGTEIASSPLVAEGVTPPFGRLLTAMVTPFTADGGLDLDGAATLARHLVEQGNDGLVISGTTGEAPTTSDEEQDLLLRAVREAVGGAVPLLAGVGTNDTAHSVHLARQAERAGADGLLLVTPYYNRPPQDGIIAHTRAVADATGLGMLLYDIPVRTGMALTADTIKTLAEHPRVVGVKDAKADLESTAEVLAATDLAYYSGDDALTLPLLSIGAIGSIGTVTHLVPDVMRDLLVAFDKGDTVEALRLHRRLLPVVRAVFRHQGAISIKAALRHLGLPAGPMRLPLVDLQGDRLEVLLTALRAAEAIPA